MGSETVWLEFELVVGSGVSEYLVLATNEDDFFRVSMDAFLFTGDYLSLSSRKVGEAWLAMVEPQ